jgi:hypothetical protein
MLQRVCAELTRSTRLVAMRAERTVHRAPPSFGARSRPVSFGRLVALGAFALSAVLAGAGCDTIDSAQRVISRADLVNELANRLSRSGDLTYAADYQLSGGKTASVVQAQDPQRSAYTYPDGKLIVTVDAITECKPASSTMTCTLTPPPTPNSDPAASAFAGAQAKGLVAPTLVVGLLTAAALDADAVISQYDSTTAGQHSTCVKVSNVQNAAASAFDACITTDGVLGSFSGVVNGATIEVSMINYTDEVPTGAFDVPAGAKVVDQRPK